MVHSARNRAVFWAAMVMMLCVGCGHGFDVKESTDALHLRRGSQRQVPLPEMPVVVMSEPFFSGSFESYQTYQKAYDLVEVMSGEGIPTVAPWEYRKFRQHRSMAHGTDVLWLLREEGIPSEEAVRLELRVIMLGGVRHVSAGGKHSQASNQPGELHITLSPLEGDAVWATLVLGFEEDPLSEKVSTFDGLPELSRALRVAGRWVATVLHDRYPARDRRLTQGVKVAFNPQPMFQYASSGGRALRERFTGLDPMELLAYKLRYYQYFDPDISMDRMMDFEGKEGGLLVEDPGVLSQFGVLAGDYITSVDGRAAVGPQALWRPILWGRTPRVELSLERKGKVRRIIVPLSG